MSRKGFTLIEAMIVVAIIGILAAIILPLFKDDHGPHKPKMFDETCLAGYVFIKHAYASSDEYRQLIGADGKPVACGINAKEIEIEGND